ncbi:MAG: hypothetical protein ABSG64_10115 [Solirubrobacteraceae bacterium]
MIYVVTRQRGAGWQDALPLSAQRDWSEHAACMDALHDEGFLLLAGTLEHGALLIVDAEREEDVEARLSADPWTASGLLATTSIEAWEIRLGEIAGR